MKKLMIRSAALLPLLVSAVVAHGYHPKAKDMIPDPDWATMHMAEEHHIANFDPTSFFTLHDFNSDGHWDASEIRLFYGMDSSQDPSHATSEDHKEHALRDVFALFDPEHSGIITKEQWLRHHGEGRRLPDFGMGPGHHGDDEYEYEIHHFEKFHGGDDVKEEDLNHPEDVEHFKLHDRLEDEKERIRKMEATSEIAEQNIPSKFRKQE